MDLGRRVLCETGVGEVTRMRSLVVVLLGGALLMFGSIRSADALPAFKKAFEAKYVDNNKDEAFKEVVKKQSCNVCHVKGESKKERNAFGDALAQLIEGDAQARLKEAGDNKSAEEEKILKELEEAFKKVEATKIDPENTNSETYGDRLKANKLPVEPVAE
jgi:hypothetical protein